MTSLRSLLGGHRIAILLVACLFCAVFALAGCSGDGGGSDTGTDDSQQAADASGGSDGGALDVAGDAQGTADQGGGEAADSSGGGDTYGTWADECTDANGYPTAYAVMELKGWQFETMLQEMDFTFTDDGTNKGWVNPDNTCAVIIGNSSGSFDDEQIAELDKGGVGTPVTYVISATKGYKSAEDALAGMTPMVVEDTFVVDDTAAACVAYGPSMTECLVVATGSADAGFAVTTFNQEAIADGLAKNLLSVDGTTIDSLWINLTGHTPSEAH